MTESKKEWVEPELIVLVRSKPEEAVLSGCKQPQNTGDESVYEGCMRILGDCFDCFATLDS